MANTADMFKRLTGQNCEAGEDVVVPTKSSLEAQATSAGQQRTPEEMKRLMDNCMPGVSQDYCPK